MKGPGCRFEGVHARAWYRKLQVAENTVRYARVSMPWERRGGALRFRDHRELWLNAV